MDRRLMPANDRVAAENLRGKVQTEHFVQGTARQLSVPLADVLNAPGGQRDRQVVRGETMVVYEDHEGWAFVQLERDGYVGYVPSHVLQAPVAITHRIVARSSHLYPAADFKQKELGNLSFGSFVQVTGQSGQFAETPDGFIPSRHLQAVNELNSDPVAIAEKFLGTPYLWGGNSGWGIDCSGLVQAACLACGIDCLGDSDLQQKMLGNELSPDSELVRGDLLFWKGHVAWVVDATRLLHANAYHMAVVMENLHSAIDRIDKQDDGTVLSRKRLKM